MQILDRDKLESNNSLEQVLRIIRTENIGPHTYYNLLKVTYNLEQLIDFIPELLNRSGKKNIQLCKLEKIKQEIEQTYQFGAEYLLHSQFEFPELLKKISGCPPVLVIKGNKKLLALHKIAIVGSRNASHNNLLLAEKWSEILSGKYVVVSGLARGIDKFAHQGAIANGTIAIVAGGIDIIYPQENKNLYTQIGEQGLIVTEMPFRMQPLAKHFPQRNRIISGLSLGILVIEAGLQSGSLITARYAAEHNRECFAVPGSPLEVRSHGTNKLIKEGAYLVESAQEILEIMENNSHKMVINDNSLSFENDFKFKSLPNDLETLKVKQKILELISFTPVSINSLLSTHNFDLSVFHIALIELEIAGDISRISNNLIIKIYKSE